MADFLPNINSDFAVQSVAVERNESMYLVSYEINLLHKSLSENIVQNIVLIRDLLVCDFGEVSIVFTLIPHFKNGKQFSANKLFTLQTFKAKEFVKSILYQIRQLKYEFSERLPLEALTMCCKIILHKSHPIVTISTLE